MSKIKVKLKEMGIELPTLPQPLATYRPSILSGHKLYVSGQIPTKSGKLISQGLVSREVSIPESLECAKVCFLNMLAVAEDSIGDLDKISQIIRLEVFIACHSDFFDHSKIANGASDLAVKLFGQNGSHTRLAVGVSSLPMNAPVEISGIFKINT